jgi:hypothetical protein
LLDESKIIFFTGAPGSKWSATANLFAKSTRYSVNTSDHNCTRTYVAPGGSANHKGAYFGPGFEFGNNFHLLDSLGKEQIMQEIDRPYSDKNSHQFRIIKCHQFSLHLDFIKQVFPHSKIIMVTRPDSACLEHWQSAGGFDITYPDYQSYYRDTDTMALKIRQENQYIKKFIAEQNLQLNHITELYLSQMWKVGLDTSESQKYFDSIVKRTVNGKQIRLLDTSVACHNFLEI